jgi:4-hydroxy-3-prenylphenylpyruvate oxygenase / 4-hydroxy-3-prenylbenzoate synthase
MSTRKLTMPANDFFRRPPEWADPALERRYRKVRAAAAFRVMAKLGYEEGLAGLITVEDPEHRGTYWANPLGTPLGRITVDDLVQVDGPTCEVVEGERPVNIGAFNIHAQVHQARPDVQAVVHMHSTFGRTFSTLGRKLDPITPYACPFFEDHEVFEDFTGIVLDEEDGRRIGKTLGAHKAIILRNHGLLTVAQTVDAAVWWFALMEKSCEIQLAAEAAGPRHRIAAQTARTTRDQIGSHLIAWNSYQPMYQTVIRDEPDLFGKEGPLL